MPTDTILLAMELSPQVLAEIRARIPAATTVAAAPRKLLEHAPLATALAAWGDLSPILPSLVAAAPQLTWVHCLGGDATDLGCAALRHPGRPRVTWRRGLGATLVAEHTLAALLALRGRVPLHIAQAARGEWRHAARTELAGPLGIAGCGPIGAAVARLGAAMGLAVTVLDHGPTASLPRQVAVLDEAGRRELLRQSQNLVVALPARAQGWLGRDEIQLLPPRAQVVNLAPPGVVDEAALGEALRSGALAGIALLGPRREPPPPMLDHPGTILSPIDLAHWPALQIPALRSFLRSMACLATGAHLPQGVTTFEPSSS